MFSQCEFIMIYVVLLVWISAVLIEKKIVLGHEVTLDCPPGYYINGPNGITSYKLPEWRRIDG